MWIDMLVAASGALIALCIVGFIYTLSYFAELNDALDADLGLSARTRALIGENETAPDGIRQQKQKQEK